MSLVKWVYLESRQTVVLTSPCSKELKGWRGEMESVKEMF